MIEFLTGINLIWIRNAFYNASFGVIEDVYVLWIEEIGHVQYKTKLPNLEGPWQTYSSLCSDGNST
jgi:hypothetical protein